jgi:hypothetical protein
MREPGINWGLIGAVVFCAVSWAAIVHCVTAAIS